MPLLMERRSAQRHEMVSDLSQTPSPEPTRPVVFDPMTCLCGSRLPMQVRLGLKSRTRPVIEGRWSCSESCLRARVSSFVRRELQQGQSGRVHQHRVPLGLLLLQSGRISLDQLQYALRLSRDSEHRIGEVLVRECGLSEDKLAAALGQQWGCGSWDVRGIQPHVAACFAPHLLLKRTGMLPVRELRDGQLGVAFTESPDAQAIFALQRIHARAVNAGITAASQFDEAAAKVFQVDGVPVVDAECDSGAELVHEIARCLTKFQPVESRWARVHNLFWVRLWLEPAALLGGITQREDVLDLVVRLPEGISVDGET